MTNISSYRYENATVDRVSHESSPGILGGKPIEALKVTIEGLPAPFYCVDTNLMPQIEKCHDLRKPLTFTASEFNNLIQKIEPSAG